VISQRIPPENESPRVGYARDHDGSILSNKVIRAFFEVMKKRMHFRNHNYL